MTPGRPATTRFCVEWENGKTAKVRNKTIRFIKDYTARSREEAEAVAAEKRAAGFKNVKIREALL
ncbi:MAG: hypothetical protein ACI4HO_08630 [Ruminococcus sp.]